MKKIAKLRDFPRKSKETKSVLNSDWERENQVVGTIASSQRSGIVDVIYQSGLG
jgi:hypothetical protein